MCVLEIFQRFVARPDTDVLLSCSGIWKTKPNNPFHAILEGYLTNMARCSRGVVLREETVYAIAEVIAFFDDSSPADIVDEILHCIGRGDAVFSRYNGIPKTLPGIVSDLNRLLFISTGICHFFLYRELRELKVSASWNIGSLWEEISWYKLRNSMSQKVKGIYSEVHLERHLSAFIKMEFSGRL